MKKFEIIRIKDTTTGWKEENDMKDLGVIQGYLRGYNIEIEKDGELDYVSCLYVHGELEDYLQSELDAYGVIIATDYAESKGWKITGRAIFRGYYTEEYDPEEREWFVYNASNEVKKLACTA